MRCTKNCKCILCLELHGCEKRFNEAPPIISNNFILTRSSALVRNAMRPKKFTFFGGSGSDFDLTRSAEKAKRAEKFSMINSSADNIHQIVESKIEGELITESLHKSVIYVNDLLTCDENNNDTQNVVLNEKVDEVTQLDTVQDSNVVNVVFKDTFAYASQILNDLNVPEDCNSDVESDDFPLGIEAHYFNKQHTNRAW